MLLPLRCLNDGDARCRQLGVPRGFELSVRVICRGLARHTATPSTFRAIGLTPAPPCAQVLPSSRQQLRNGASAASASTLASMLARFTPAAVPTDVVKHFSYGANMASSTLAKRGVQVTASRPAVIVDPNTAISFRHRGGFATLIRGPPVHGGDPKLQRGDVHGVLYTLSRASMAALQRAETGYALEAVRVCVYPPAAAPACIAAASGSIARGGKPVSIAGSLASATSICEGNQDGTVLASVFVSRPMLRLRNPVPPTDRYLEMLRAGARVHGLDPVYSDWLASVPSVGRSGLPPEYFNTESNVLAQGFLALVVLAIMCLFAPHREHTVVPDSLVDSESAFRASVVRG